ncbi:putative mediator of RNA polymerase II transcription subunit 26 isoform X2 [Neodiprion lecontei]|uniref:Mediator of RNA polymerase II transcription subunit 26 isoform X2 n=1 Tax=Neodiprion lecontei TaxID=441921 RepID=A0ABM3FLV5_NEOLC|nr:putative mediator of RNA polymerase II transcription subunit 26 isoform X2 [Neodiprion lecontei]
MDQGANLNQRQKKITELRYWVVMALQYHLNPPMQSTMGGANLHTPQSVFQHMMGQQNSPQQGGPWLQMPQVPALSMPWSVPALQQPDLIRFTGERSQPAYDTMSLHQKRKLSTPDITDTRQIKQFITEEKMASHFQGLHISSNYQAQNSPPSTSTAHSPQRVCNNLEYMNSNMESAEGINLDQNDCRKPRLVISEEVRRLQEEPLIPTSLLSKLERPSMALVLWEPPSKHLARVLPVPRDTPTPIPNFLEDGNNNNNNNNNNRNSNNNNNNNGIIDLNQCSPQLEPMEL